MILHTRRLILRPWRESDVESLYEYARDERIGPVAGWLPHTDVENSREIIRSVLSAPETYAVCLREEDRAIGSIGLMTGSRSNIGLPEQEGEIGYWIGVPFWGRGLIPEAAGELIRHAFADLHLETLWCGYFDGNDKSRRVQEKCGFTYHHTKTDLYWKQTGDVRTEHIMRLTAEEWKDRFVIRPCTEEEIPEALDFAWSVFYAYDTPDYAPEGTEEFRKCLHDEEYLSGITHIGAFDGDRLIGELGFRPAMDHVCFFFVDGDYQRMGVGTKLFRYLQKEHPGETITINSSPYGLPFYRSLGFEETGPEQTVHGIRFTPMVYRASPETGS